MTDSLVRSGRMARPAADLEGGDVASGAAPILERLIQPLSMSMFASQGDLVTELLRQRTEAADAIVNLLGCLNAAVRPFRGDTSPPRWVSIARTIINKVEGQ